MSSCSCRWRKTVWFRVNMSGQLFVLFLQRQVLFIHFYSTEKGGLCLLIHFQSVTFTWFFLLSGFGCHYLHLHKGACQTDPYLEGCRVYKPLNNGVSFISSHVILFTIIFGDQHPSGSPFPERMLERWKWQPVSWEGPERGNLWLWQPMLLLQPDQTGVCSCVWRFVTNCLILTPFCLHLFSEPGSCVQQFCGGTLLPAQVHWTKQVPNPGVWLWMGGLSGGGDHSGNMTTSNWHIQFNHPSPLIYLVFTQISQQLMSPWWCHHANSCNYILYLNLLSCL